MGFDIATAKPVEQPSGGGAFDLATAKPVDDYSPLAGESSFQKARAGYGKAVMDVAIGIKQRWDDAAAWLEQTVPGFDKVSAALGQSAVKIRDEGRAAEDERQQRDAALMADTAGSRGHLAGSIVTTAPVAMIPGANTVAGSALVGAGLGAAQPTGTNDSALKNAAIGAAAGAGGTLALRGAAAVAQPVYSGAVNRLMAAGVPLTPGQMMGGAWKRVEDAATSVPVLGDSIRNAQRRSMDSMNRAVGNEALAPIGQTLPDGITGRAAVQHTERALGGAYDSVLQRIGPIQVDGQFAADLGGLRSMVQNGNMAPEAAAQFEAILQNQVLGKFQGQNAVTAETMKAMEGDLGRLSRRLQRDPSSDKQILGDAVQEMQASLRSLVQRQAPPELAGELQAANQGWALFKRMQRAASMVGAEDGTFSPAQYLSAVKAMDPSKDKAAFARGSALGQDLAQSAKSVMGSSVPDSGTALRSWVHHPVSGSALLAPSILGAGLYTEPAQNVVRAMMTARPAVAGPVSRALATIAPYGGTTAADLASVKGAGE